ncbi:UTRA domain-containing protein [Pseudoalteromonas sp. MMG013]|uniref:UTRA domain-containing protein n=1 Tax=Pseudoalteromonas sp. MMG013 TaxID=2822687 RepID=UPI001B373D87|nr:UTRA domain-containing protein [Pseudoalteromonas sp. MMG013]MBQ4863746.1 UTRA domain-containing protein [Pseudoalteromonas sp. MMG013]
MLLYQVIRNHIQSLVAEGRLQAGSKLSSERALQEQFNSTRITVREALARLESEGVIFSQKRRGWFVTPDKLKWHPARKVNFNALAQKQGFVPSTEVIEIQSPSNTHQVSHHYFDSKPVYKLTRARYLDGRGILIEEIYCLADRFEGLEQQPLNGSITQVMQHSYQVNVSHEKCEISVTVLPDRAAELLEKNSGAPCLKVQRARYDEHQALVDYNIEFWLHDAIEMIIEGK